jgi:RNA polymerase sporulation-specific sigma factor
MQLRKSSKIRGEVSFDEPLNYDVDGNELLLSDILYTESDTVSKNLDQSVEKQLLWESIKKLNGREQEIMILRFGLAGKEEKTQKEVADMMGISQSYISRIEKKILDRLKKDLLKASNF